VYTDVKVVRIMYTDPSKISERNQLNEPLPEKYEGRRDEQNSLRDAIYRTEVMPPR
jgi:hypothetical protein